VAPSRFVPASRVASPAGGSRFVTASAVGVA
jgi:hypothetical protein